MNTPDVANDFNRDHAWTPDQGEVINEVEFTEETKSPAGYQKALGAM